MTDIRCEVDGFAVEGGLWIDAPCAEPAAYRYRPAGQESAWRYRCVECAKWPDRDGLTIQRVTIDGRPVIEEIGDVL